MQTSFYEGKNPLISYRAEQNQKKGVRKPCKNLEAAPLHNSRPGEIEFSRISANFKARAHWIGQVLKVSKTSRKR
uniref:Uncharacterized protein n=1 Tax=Salix viminalis TaxID=40686 RepID=A0A6N2LIV6_SALVM